MYRPHICFRITDWPHLFPNVLHFDLILEGNITTDLDELPYPLSFDDEGQIVKLTECDPSYFNPWARLHTIKEKSKFMISTSIFGAGLFTKLTTIHLDYSLYNDTAIFAARQSLLSVLHKNAQHLKTLKINKMPMSIASLDRLHANLPTLQDLCLTECSFIYTDEADYSEITPAYAIQRLKLGMLLDSKSEHAKVQVAQYVSRKYIEVEDLRLDCENNYETERWNACILGIFRRCRKLKQFDVGAIGYSKPMLQALDRMPCCKIPSRYFATLGKFEELKLLSYSKQRFHIEEMIVSQRCHSNGAELVRLLGRFPNLVSFCLNKHSPHSIQEGAQRLNIPVNTLLGDHPKLLRMELNDCKVYKANFDSTPSSTNVDPNDYSNKSIYYPLEYVKTHNVELYNKPCMMNGILRSTENWFFARMYLRCIHMKYCQMAMSLAYESVNNMPEDHALYHEPWDNPVIIDFNAKNTKLEYINIQIEDCNQLVLADEHDKRTYYTIEKIPYEQESEYIRTNQASDGRVLYIRSRQVNDAFDLSPFEDPFDRYEHESDEEYYDQYGGANFFERIFDDGEGYFPGGYGQRRSSPSHLDVLPFYQTDDFFI
ncbi:hypothetical protein A0J61_07901 [Choanephora cucurbitarum]|uniref:Uncharacterized protein n=1 Tax=Choanephora cucurbitarum TaxID=101091 RepID=A0A1C7N4N4_9FUNG|nr:hypothetical protein A0J61_07901 [Choanephora cucurbitarum]